MRTFLGLFIAAAVYAVSGSSLLSQRQTTGYPACTDTCLANPDLGNCAAQEVECLCKDSTFIQTTSACFQKNCNAADLAQADQVAEEVCAAAGVTLAGSSTTTSPAASTATSPTTTGSSSSSSSTPSASTAANKSSGAASNAVNILGGAAALGLTALML